MHGVLPILCHPDTNYLISAEAGELGAVPELELDQVDEQVVGRRRDGAGEDCAGGGGTRLLLGFDQVEE